MSSANEIQHGGDHYRGNEYQHWDWVCDTGLPYVLGCATKYVSRWKQKGGVLDLQKAAHYVQKAKERGIEARPSWRGADTARFLAQFDIDEARTMMIIVMCNFDAALQEIRLMELAASAEA